MKKIFSVLILVTLAILVFFGFVYFIWKMKRTQFYEFENEMTVIIEENSLTEYQEEKIKYKMEEYRVEKNYILDPYYVDGFNRYLKSTDYDFWYEVRIIFKE